MEKNEPHPHPSWIEIDEGQFRKNIRAVRKRIGQVLFCLPVKANAYGHGLIEIGKIAIEEGVDYLGVSCLKEGIYLRKAKIQAPIVVFGAIHEDQIENLIRFNLEFSISSKFKAEIVKEVCGRLKEKCSVHLEVDTGMQRTGVRPETALSLLSYLRENPCFEIKGVYSHLATADCREDAFTEFQIDTFSYLREKVGAGEYLWHLANSGGVLHYPRSYFDMVRPGLLCYGYLPSGEKDSEIKPCFSLKSKISYFKAVASDKGVSYGHLYRTKEPTRLVTIPIGYGDGYLRAFSNKAPVLIREQRYVVSGAVCMDQFMVDIGKSTAYVGDEVTLIGKGGKEEISLWELAKLCQTIPYELLTLFNERLPRKYIKFSCAD